MYKVKINAEGQQRKDLANKIGELVGVEPVYAGAGGNTIEGERFRFSYVVMNITIAQDATVIWDERTDGETMDKVFDGLEQAGYEFERPAPAAESEESGSDQTDHVSLDNSAAANEEQEAPEAEAEEEPETEAGEAPAFEDLALTEREELGLGQERRDHPGEDGMQASDIPEPERRTYQAEFSGPGSMTIEMPLKGFTPEKLYNLTSMVLAKEELLKAALGADSLPIELTNETVQFPWFTGDLDAEHANAYAHLVTRLCATAIEKKRVVAKESERPENPKYAMRCFLLSLGFIGDEYKSARKILLSKLDGNSSWKYGKPAEADAETGEIEATTADVTASEEVRDELAN